MNEKNKILSLFIFLLNFINFIQSENFINKKDTKSIIDLKIKGNELQKILGSRPFPDLIYLNGNITLIDELGYIFIENDNEINEVTLIWMKKINTCEYLFNSSNNIIEIDLSNFDTSLVTSMKGMFENCEKLQYIDFGDVNTSSVINMSNMFFNCNSLISLDLSNFDTFKTKLMDRMFYGCNLLTSLDITNFNTSNVESISNMFYGCKSLLKIDLSFLDVSKVTNMEYLFRDCFALTSLNLNSFNTSKVKNMKGLFVNCLLLKKLEISNLDTSKVEDMSFMFFSCESLTSLNLSNFKTSLVRNMKDMFYHCSSLIYVDISSFDTTNVNNMNSMFSRCTSLKSLDISNFKLYLVDMEYFLELSISLESVKFSKNYINYAYGFAMFSHCYSLKSIDLYRFVFVDDIGYLFSECHSLTSLDLSLVNTNYVYGMYNSFQKCYSLKSLNLSNWNTRRVQMIDYMFYDCKSLISLDLSNFDTSSVFQMNNIFFNCIELISLNLSKFNTSLVNDMNSMFYGCISLETLDLSNFNTTKVKNMKSMFFDCKKLKSLDLSNFNTINVDNMAMMFSGCSSLEFLNFTNYKNELNILTTNIFYETDNNLIIFINNVNYKNIINLIPELSSFRCITNNNALINQKNLKIINENKICLDECYNDKIYSYEFNNLCYKECPKGTISSSSDKYLCEFSNVECVEEYPFKILEDNSCSDYCNCEDFFNGLCTISNYNIESQSALIINIVNGIIEGSMDKILFKYINEERKDLINKVNNTIYQITSSFNQKNINYQNISVIDLGECEKIIKEKYIISKNETLLFFKIERYIEGLLIPFIEYEIFNLKTKEQLNLNVCKNSNINITVKIPVSINESVLYKYYLNSSYYNDICNISYKEKNGVDITLYDRKNEYINNNLYLCTINCIFIGYNKNNKTVECLCQAQSGIILYTDIDKEHIISSLTNIKNKFNFNVMKCYNLLFSKEGLNMNFGNYMLLFIILLHIGSAIFFYFKGFNLFCNEINEILYIKNIEIKNKLKFKGKIKENIISKTNIDKKKDTKNNYEVKLSIDLNLSKDSLENKEKVEMDINENEKPIVYLNYEKNILSYEEAKKNDKRTYFQYYKSLILINNLFIFSFYSNKDYNPYIIKICMFFFLLALNLVVDTLFFNDYIMHEIYRDKGSYNFICFLPQIIYSVVIFSIISLIIKSVILSQRNILEIKYEKNKYNIKPKVITVIKCLIIKFLCFYIFSFVLLILFWYYISCFSIVYKSTQMYLFINSLIGLIIIFLYPFIFCLLPGIFRIPSLKSPGKYLYEISKIIQIL